MALSIRQSAASTRENIYWPTGAPKGGIVCLHGSEGGWAGWNDLHCALFAANGFVALSRNYTQDARWLTHPDIDDVPLEGTQAALAAVRAEVAPFACGVGLFGISRGAEHALLIAKLKLTRPRGAFHAFAGGMFHAHHPSPVFAGVQAADC